tara:strand:- start:28 stop:702 length:675 start_codon:yes stop_codon:yes gene_type:complete
MSKNNYISTIYNNTDRPLTNYPIQLCKYLSSKYDLKLNSKVLEIGCGRGDFLKAFKELGNNIVGTDISEESKNYFEEDEIYVCNIENEKLPFKNNEFDMIFNKSLIEHLYSPDNFFNEAFRVLKPGGLMITMVPDWESNYKIYYDDFTHKSPYTKQSLYDAYQIYGFSKIETYTFRQLPLLWKYPLLNIVSYIVSFISPIRSKNKFLRWSRELMVIGKATKPLK